jgi:transcriptional regulator GlxA family with amidase domain
MGWLPCSQVGLKFLKDRIKSIVLILEVMLTKIMAARFLKLLKAQDWERVAVQGHFRPEEMAAVCMTCLRQLQRHFAEHFHKTPGAFAKEVQMRMAVQLIAQGWKSLAVAQELCFGNESHLCHDFQRHFGAPPQSFARQHSMKSPTIPANNEAPL